MSLLRKKKYGKKTVKRAKRGTNVNLSKYARNLTRNTNLGKTLKISRTMASKMEPEIYLQKMAEFLDKLTEGYERFSPKKLERHEYIATIIIQEVEGVLPELGINIEVDENEGDVFAYVDSLYNTINEKLDEFDELEDKDNIDTKRVELYLLASELHKAIIVAKNGYKQFSRTGPNNVEMNNAPRPTAAAAASAAARSSQANNRGNDDMGDLLNMLASAKI